MPPSQSAARPPYLIVGQVLRPHGIDGTLRIRIMTDYPERIGQLDAVYLADSVDSAQVRKAPVASMQMAGQYGLLRLSTISTRDQAERLRHLFVMVAIDDAVPLEQGEFYLYQLIGLRVFTEDGAELGTVTDVIETGANDVYVVRSDQGTPSEVLIPAIEQVIIRTDIESGEIIVRLPEGLLDAPDA